MNILTEDERAALLRALAEAPDEVLIDAVRQRKDWMKNIRSSFDEVRSFVGMKITRENPLPPPAGRETGVSASKMVDNDVKQPSHPTPRPNVNPGRSSITKIGTKTRDEIVEDLKKEDRFPDEYKNGKMTEHLKLLHNRGEIKFDGERYYL